MLKARQGFRTLKGSLQPFVLRIEPKMSPFKQIWESAVTGILDQRSLVRQA
jgi:hypothetical protein